MTIQFYYDILSQPCRTLYIFLKINNLPFNKHVVNLAKGHHRTEEFRKMNPLSLVPFIEENGFVLRESVGIMRYLCREKNIPDHWYPKDYKAQAKIDEFIEWHHLGLRFPLTMFFRICHLEPLLTGKEPQKSDVERYTNAMKNSCDVMENIWLNKDCKFLFGDHLTIADLLAAMEIEQPRMCGYDPRDGRPKLTEYMDHVQSETNPYYDEACKLLNSISAKKISKGELKSTLYVHINIVFLLIIFVLYLFNMVLKLYYDTFSQPSRAVYLFLRINDIPFEKQNVNLMTGEHKKDEFKKINPLSLVPVIDDNGFILRESVGILRYLAHEKNLADHWYPRDSKTQARVDEFIEWQHLGLRIPLALFFRVGKLVPMLTGRQPPSDLLERVKKEMVNSCNVFEKFWLASDKKFLFGNNLSIADLLAVMELEQPRMAGYDPREGRPKLAMYMDRVRAATNPYYDEVCEMVYNFIKSKL
ncbi:uncharacterized protein [Halyomorpha halys]|uniref:uncharacterized protein n=1 Tax=Halyomorpha halys TaxID=286706 RepID=UPI0034D1E22F